ncbi:hypothetical protein J5X84_31920 [Streptosporangiaceae bacterium NEAU-GS5]|nr:hypothetical protein [Streptosporangiaceae bacterium NEAU-GS5]
MAVIAQQQIDDLALAVAGLYGRAVADPADANMVDAVARLWEQFDYKETPLAILQIFLHALEIGYATAVQDVRAGVFDDDIKLWRPRLAEAAAE